MYPRLFELGPITVYTYGVLLAAAYLFGLKLAMVRAKTRGLDANRVLDLGIYIIISALVGAKLLLLVTDFRAFTSDPRELLTLARSGGVFYGGLILAVTVALIYIRKVGLPLRPDAVRAGCLCAGGAPGTLGAGPRWGPARRPVPPALAQGAPRHGVAAPASVNVTAHQCGCATCFPKQHPANRQPKRPTT